jgi:hypothetical protein
MTPTSNPTPTPLTAPTVEPLENGWYLVRTAAQLTFVVSQDAVVVTPDAVINVTLEPDEEDGEAVVYLACAVVTPNPDYQVTSRIGPFAPDVQLGEVPIALLVKLLADLLAVQRAPSEAVQAALTEPGATVDIELEPPRLTLHTRRDG